MGQEGRVHLPQPAAHICQLLWGSGRGGCPAIFLCREKSQVEVRLCAVRSSGLSALYFISLPR
jgi:hypothetical protein